MNIEKNIYNIVNTVISTIHKEPYYTTEISNFNLEFKDIDKIWDYFKTISNEYKEKYKLHEDIVISDELIDIYKNNNIFKTIFTLHILNENPHVVTFNLGNNENIFILYKNNSEDLPSKFISLTMPDPLENDNLEKEFLKISCYFED
jgi:hypothetical protein